MIMRKYFTIALTKIKKFGNTLCRCGSKITGYSRVLVEMKNL